jgi:RNA polymerase sigma-70 factor (ECF subfamily)
LSTETELIKQAQAGDKEAFCLLTRAYERRIYSLAYHYCRQSHDAEDLSQEVWLRAYVALPSFRGESSFYTWLRQIMINCFLNHRRKLLPWLEKRDQNTEPAKCDAAVEVEPALQNQLVIAKVMQALAEVTPQQRLIFLLKHLEGMTYEEIASQIGCSVGTVKKSISRTIAKLRQKLGADEEPQDFMSCAATGLLR